VVKTRVFLAIFLNHSHDVKNAKAFLVCHKNNLRNVKPFSSKLLVKRLSIENISCVFVDLFNNGKANCHQVLWQEQWIVIVRSVDPTINHIVVAVRESFMLIKPFFRSFCIKLLSHFVAQWHVHNMEASLFSEVKPFLERCSLDPINRPVPATLTFNDKQLALVPHGSDSVSIV
jgi:hypothetical protein